ncbi:hypothetical protein MKX03_008122, partial [Papaver bracteatum]
YYRKKKQVSAENDESPLVRSILDAKENLNERFVIGRGAHGIVYKASANEEEHYALKKLDFVGWNRASASMVREIQTVTTIRHQNLNAYSTIMKPESYVYSYGVVLLELLTRNKALDTSFPEVTVIVRWVNSTWINDKSIDNILVRNILEKTRVSLSLKDEVTKVLLLALQCTRTDPNERPSMRDVVKVLKDANSRGKSK